MNAKSIKESDDPEFTRDFRVVLGRESVVKEHVSQDWKEWMHKE